LSDWLSRLNLTLYKFPSLKTTNWLIPVIESASAGIAPGAKYSTIRGIPMITKTAPNTNYDFCLFAHVTVYPAPYGKISVPFGAYRMRIEFVIITVTIGKSPCMSCVDVCSF
jgi:hypothetical protein